ncbi:MAG: 30S ribosomal protein S7 [Candidatus Dojkabacteria bacterium]|nr:30S ribosomal protein S7 [Candidatus Dojkabacteria bacterium]
MRSKKPVQRKIKPDERYNSIEIAKFINYVMKDGKKQIAIEIVYKALDAFSKMLDKKDVLKIFLEAIENVKPKIEVRSRRVGGANLQVPVPVTKNRQFTLACKWIIQAARDTRKKEAFWQVLSKELVNAYRKEGGAIKKRDEVHKIAEANRAFSQFA